MSPWLSECAPLRSWYQETLKLIFKPAQNAAGPLGKVALLQHIPEGLCVILTLGNKNQDLCSWWGQSPLLLRALTSQWTTEAQEWQSRWSQCFLPGVNSVHPFLPSHIPSRPYIFLFLWENSTQVNQIRQEQLSLPLASNVIWNEEFPDFRTLRTSKISPPLKKRNWQEWYRVTGFSFGQARKFKKGTPIYFYYHFIKEILTNVVNIISEY